MVDHQIDGKLRAILERLNITRQQLATKLGVNRSTVCRWFLGWSAPSAHSLVLITELVQREVPAFTGGHWLHDLGEFRAVLGVPSERWGRLGSRTLGARSEVGGSTFAEATDVSRDLARPVPVKGPTRAGCDAATMVRAAGPAIDLHGRGASGAEAYSPSESVRSLAQMTNSDACANVVTLRAKVGACGKCGHEIVIYIGTPSELAPPNGPFASTGRQRSAGSVA